jgi:hypothetical protein
VKKATVVDGDDVDASSDAYSVENFMKALEEEAKANAAFFGDSGDVFSGGGGGSGGRTPEQTIALVRKTDSPMNWCYFTANV